MLDDSIQSFHTRYDDAYRQLSISEKLLQHTSESHFAYNKHSIINLSQNKKKIRIQVRYLPSMGNSNTWLRERRRHIYTSLAIYRPYLGLLLFIR